MSKPKWNRLYDSMDFWKAMVEADDNKTCIPCPNCWHEHTCWLCEISHPSGMCDPLKRGSDYEEYVGDQPGQQPGTWKIFRGHPQYCPIEVPHYSHEFHYSYIRHYARTDPDRQEATTGSYYCDGDPRPWAER